MLYKHVSILYHLYYLLLILKFLIFYFYLLNLLQRFKIKNLDLIQNFHKLKQIYQNPQIISSFPNKVKNLEELPIPKPPTFTAALNKKRSLIINFGFTPTIKSHHSWG